LSVVQIVIVYFNRGRKLWRWERAEN